MPVDTRPANIHPYTDDKTGETKYAVCLWDAYNANWHRPLDKNESGYTGCSGEYARKRDYFGGFSKRQAYSRANVLFGYARIQKMF
jgi:hypothetical protein